METPSQPKNPMIEAAERYIENMQWSQDATDHEKSLVKGNIMGFVSSLGGHIPAASQYATKRDGTRRKIFPISTEILRQMITEGAEVKYKITQGLPADAKILDICPDIFKMGMASLLVESESFDEVAQGGQYPIGHDITAETIA